jgi:hypothetical protein
MVATAQGTDRAVDARGARPAGGGWQGNARPHKRTLNQNAVFHALCNDIAKSKVEWGGCRRTADEWKVLLVSGHAVAQGRAFDLVGGLEGEMVQLRESTASMSKERSTSLIDYTIAWAVSHGIQLRDGE